MVLGGSGKGFVHRFQGVVTLTEMQIGLGEVAMIMGERKLGAGGAVKRQTLPQLVERLRQPILQGQAGGPAQRRGGAPEREALLVGNREHRLGRGLRRFAKTQMVLQPTQMVKAIALAERMSQRLRHLGPFLGGRQRLIGIAQAPERKRAVAPERDGGILTRIARPELAPFSVEKREPGVGMFERLGELAAVEE